MQGTYLEIGFLFCLLPITRKKLAAIIITQLKAAPITSYIFLVTGKGVHPAGGHSCLAAVKKNGGRVGAPPGQIN